MEHGIPSEDTFRRWLARLDPHAFEQCFRKWVQTFSPSLPREILHLDGQQLRHSFDTPCDQAALTLVRVWASQLPLVLATASVEVGSNEIPLAGSLLALFDLHGCTVIAGAAHCQTQTNYGQGRQEVRPCRVLIFAPHDPDWQDVQAPWRGLRSLVRSVALNLLRLAPGSGGIAARQRRAGWDNEYLLRIVKN